jgi:hypothetical protein
MAYGTYVTSCGSGSTADTFTLRILETPMAVSEPASLGLFGAGLLGLRWARRRETN